MIFPIWVLWHSDGGKGLRVVCGCRLFAVGGGSNGGGHKCCGKSKKIDFLNKHQ